MATSNVQAALERPQPSVTYRWMVLFFVSLTMFGNYYLYDSIAPVADLLRSQLNFSDQMIDRLYSFYSYAAVATLLIGGIIIDRLGTKKAVALFGTACAIAGVVTAISSDYHTMLAGRFILGFGAESLIAAVTTALAKWFKGKEIGFAFGINLTIARLGSLGTDWSPKLAKPLYSNWQSPLWLAAGIGGFCLFGALVYWALEAAAEKKYVIGQAGATDKLVLKDLIAFDRSFWYVTGLCLTFYAAIFPFRAFAIKFFQDSFDMSRESAGRLNGILPMAAMIATPLFGLLIDKVGKRALFMAVGSLIIVPAYLLMLPALHITPYLSVALIGISFSLIPAVMWPSVAYIVDEKKLGTAYALMGLIQQLGVAAIFELIGPLNDRGGASAANPSGYNGMLFLVSALGFLGLFFSFMLWRTERGPRAHGLEAVKPKA
ncbi:MAG TPA: MFS transporter [Terriglobales bacterium]|nr:MFS transporter [Terriglobales bacterium]